jgi:hypothetical protein
MKANSLPLTAFVPAGLEGPSFVTPVFGSGDNEGYMQVIDERKCVAGFEPLPRTDDTIPLPRKLDVFATIGNDPVYAFRFSPTDVIFGQRDSIVRSLRKRFPELLDYPFTRLNVASFLEDQQETENAVNNASAELCANNRGLAVDWYKSMSSAGPIVRGEAYTATANWSEIREFTLALLKFCRAQRRLASNKSQNNRHWALMEYHGAFDRIVAFFFNTRFLGILREKLHDIDQEPTQFELQFLSDADERIMSLTRLGLSRRTARFVLDEIRSSKTQSVRDIAKRDVLGLILEADRVTRNQLEISRKLNIAEKTIRKKQLKIGTISIAYGIILLLRNHTKGVGRMDDHLDELAIAALRSGLNNCAPPDEARKEAGEFQNIFMVKNTFSSRE